MGGWTYEELIARHQRLDQAYLDAKRWWITPAWEDRIVNVGAAIAICSGFARSFSWISWGLFIIGIVIAPVLYGISFAHFRWRMRQYDREIQADHDEYRA
jgi:hypothetical protein